MIDVRNVYLSYTKDYYALYDINFHVKPNEKLVVFGEKESGKSSLLRVIIGLDKPIQGVVTLKNIQVNKLHYENDLSLAYLPSNPVFIEKKSVRYNLEYPLKIRKVVKQVRDIKINNVIRSYELETLENIAVNNLSHFDRVKTALARFATRNVEIFIIDDVFENLTETENKKIIKYILDLIKTNDATAIIAVSDMSIAEKISNNIITLKNGSITQD